MPDGDWAWTVAPNSTTNAAAAKAAAVRIECLFRYPVIFMSASLESARTDKLALLNSSLNHLVGKR
jgi:hypothetical protein